MNKPVIIPSKTNNKNMERYLHKKLSGAEVIKFTEQELTEEQKEQARTNIGAANDLEVIKSTTQTLTVEQKAQARENIDVLSMIETFGYLQSLGIDASYDGYIEWVYSENPLKRPLTIEATEDNTGVIFQNTPRIDDSNIFGEEMTIEFSIDNGRTWNSVNSTEGLICTLNAGEKVELRGNNSCYNGHKITIYKECYLYGNIMSMLSSNNFETLDTIEENYCFAGFFANNNYSNKENYDIYLPATTLSERCYEDMFAVTKITKAPELPATTLANGCYTHMFESCYDLTECPELPSTNIFEYCYTAMFMGCNSLTSVPELPATTLKTSCYQLMFANCSALINAQKELPASTLAVDCYRDMFKGCTNLQESPLLYGTTIKKDCYRSMFEDCSNLAKVTLCIKGSLSSSVISSSFKYFLKNVATTGILLLDVVSGNTTQSFTREGSTISQWELGYYNAFIIHIIHINTTFDFKLLDTKWQYSRNGANWKRTTTPINLNQGDTIYIKAYSSLPNNTIPVQGVYQLTPTHYEEAEEAEYSISGDIAALLFSNATPNTNNRCTVSAAFGQDGSRSYMVSAANLKLLNESNMNNSCYAGLFRNCSKLIDAPKLPAINLTTECYRQMFINCISLSSAPELPAKTLAGGCYIEMFRGCTSLSYVKALFDELGNNTLTDWLTDVASIGIYVKSKDAIYNPVEDAGIPSGWTVETADA